ncbi:DEAD/DEAH box helicase [Agriterribacter sp.]|uniref:DEAD/DEAH box helicase n=1 Tax=Agriterribacter sp. TaxID=2821509 RepID=UPI002C721067|nr:DEAD/DEAH box helicase [Agriterribacter sp.]HRP57181.1 DEAD/DEAH box helicase [Agriterribacter sp.]
MANDVRTVLLLSPWIMADGKPAVSLLKIGKKDKAISYSTAVLEWSLVRKHFRDYPKPVRDILMNCCMEALDETLSGIKKAFELKRNEEAFDEFCRKNLIKYWHRMLEAFQPYFPLIKWYHQIRQPGKKALLTGPCSFSSFKPGLSFEVSGEQQRLRIKTNVHIHNDVYPIDIFNRTRFLLESKNEYFILSYVDYLTLEKLGSVNWVQYENAPDLFAMHILAPLDERYTVNRNGHFPKQELEVAPVIRLMLSELNNAFLMLTPQWLYDGHLVDGEWKDRFEATVDGAIRVIKRSREAETRLIQTLVALHPNFANQRNGYYYLSFADAQKKQWFLKTYHRLLQMDIEIVGMDMLRHFRYSSHTAVTTMKLLNEDEHRLLYEMELVFGQEKVPLNELQRMLLAGQKAVLLKDGSLGLLSEEWLQQYAPVLKHGKVKSNTIELLRWMAVAKQDATEEMPALKLAIQNNWWRKWEQWQSSADPLYVLPASVHATLRPYQQKAYEWMLLLNEIGAGACLADDMGLGKTLQAICGMVHFIDRHPGVKNIVVCPASLIYNWQQELERFAPGIQTIVYHGSVRQKEQLTQPGVQIVITTYHTLRSDVDWICEQSYGVAVIDESHNIKNPATQIAQAIMKLQAAFRLALSGTPVVNNTFDLYMQLNFVVPGMFGGRDFFKREYADPIDNNADEEKIATLKKLTAPFILRRTKEQVAKDLPEKTESVLWCEMNGSQRNVYEEILEQTRSSIFLEIEKSGLAKSKLSILQGMTKLRQVCSSPLLLPDKELQRCSESIKTEVLMDELDNILGSHKAVVFSQFSSMLRLLAGECKKRGLDFYHFDGQTPPVKRKEMVNAFQKEGNKVNLFLISLKAGNTGLTLTAADYVFLFDPWWNTAVETQAIDRTHRIGQTKSVFAYKMICKDTIEEKIIKLQQKKKKLSDDLVSADEGFAKSLTEEDVQYLFS